MATGFMDWLGPLEREWSAEAESGGDASTKPLAPFLCDPEGLQARAFALRQLGMADDVELALIELFAQEGWQQKMPKSAGTGSSLKFTFHRKRRVVLNKVEVSKDGVTFRPDVEGLPSRIDWNDSRGAAAALRSWTDVLSNGRELAIIASTSRKSSNARRRQPSPLKRLDIVAALDGASGDGSTGAAVATIVQELESLGVYADLTKEGVALRFPDPRGKEAPFRLARIRRKGVVRIGYFKTQLRDRGLSMEPALKHTRELAALCPQARVDENGSLLVPSLNEDEIPVRVVTIDHREAYSALLRQLVKDVRALFGASSQ